MIVKTFSTKIKNRLNVKNFLKIIFLKSDY